MPRSLHGNGTVKWTDRGDRDCCLDELDLSLDGLDFDFDLSDDPTSNRERTVRKSPVEDC